MLVASWLVCSAFVSGRRSGRSRSRICCVQVFRLLRCWSVPGVWGPHGTFVLCAARPPRGRKAYVLNVDHGNTPESVSLAKPQKKLRYLRLCKEEPSTMMVASKTQNSQLLWGVLDIGLKELGYSREDINVQVFTNDKQHILDLYCSKGSICCYQSYWPSFEMAYRNPNITELGKVLTKVAL